jgi:hypothetical protein
MYESIPKETDRDMSKTEASVKEFLLDKKF